MEKNDFFEVRNNYIDLIKKELLGPGSEISLPDEAHELISTRPDGRYSIGILYPQEQKNTADSDCTKDESLQTSDEGISDNEIENSDELPETFEESTSKYDNPGDEDNLDDEVLMALQNKPSSMGITIFGRGDVNSVNVKISFGTYRKTLVTDCKIPYLPENPETYVVPEEIKKYVDYDKEIKFLILKEKYERKELKELKDKGFMKEDNTGLYPCLYKLCDQLKDGYVREPHTANVNIKFTNDYVQVENIVPETCAKVTALRRKVSKTDNIYSITIMLINNAESSFSVENHLFQPEIRISSEDNNFSFIDYAGQADFNYLDDEEQSLQLQYRNKKNYASGLGTSVNWKINNGQGEIFTDFFPEVEVPGMDFSMPEDSSVPENTFSMRYLSDLDNSDRNDKIENLRSLVSAYEKWIYRQQDELAGLDKKYHNIGNKNLKGCLASLNRMKKGIDLLSENSKIWDAFQLSNRAMYMQRIHVKIQEKYPESYPYDKEISNILDNIDYTDSSTFGLDGISERFLWRPFQLAFLLMSIESVSNEKSSGRDIVDLIWFPTGGGKTEAYLGLTAFTIFYRRLAHLEESSGTTVIMRYTLRLLAAQQFTRASTLICACEYIRDDSTRKNPIYGKYDLGKDRITIGLWIGGEHTPNKNKEADKLINNLNNSTKADLKENKDRYNKFQMLKCPWCGTNIVKDIDNKTGKLKG